MERFAKIVINFQLLTISTKRSTLDVWQGFEYISVNLFLGTYVDNDGACSNVSNITFTRIRKK